MEIYDINENRTQISKLIAAILIRCSGIHYWNKLTNSYIY